MFGRFPDREPFCYLFQRVDPIEVAFPGKVFSRGRGPATRNFCPSLLALRSEGRVRHPERLGAFVNSVCNNVLLEHYRSSSRENLIEDDEVRTFPIHRSTWWPSCPTKRWSKRFVKFWTNYRRRTADCCGRYSWRNVTKTPYVRISAWTGTISESCYIAPSKPLRQSI